MHRRDFLYGVSASLPFLSGCTDLLSSGLETYSNEKYGYSIKYPGGWDIEEDPYAIKGKKLPASDVVIESSNSKNYIGSETVTLDDISGDTTLDTHVRSFIQTATHEGEDTFIVLKQRSFILSSGQSTEIVDVKDIEPEVSGDTTVYRKKYCFTIVDETLYTATLIMDEEEYAEYKQKATKIIESLTIK